MNVKTLSLALFLLAISTDSYGTNGYQLTGIGGYQKSLAGAVTANPGSSMTAITNPAGMARIGKRADFSMELFLPERSVDFTALGGEKSDSASKQYGVPALGWTAPLVDQDGDIYFGGGIYGTSGLGVDYPITQFSAANPPSSPFPVYFEGYSALQFWQMAPTVAWNASKELSLGVSLNLDYQSVSLKQAFKVDANPVDGIEDTTVTSLDLSRTSQVFGYGLSLGMLYDVSKQVTVGASYKSKQQFPDLEYQLSTGDIMDFTGQLPITGCNSVTSSLGTGQVCPRGTYKLALDFPSMIALGIAYSPIDSLTFSFDVKKINWSETLKTLEITGPNGAKISLPANWKDQTIMAFGVAYAVNQRLNLRAGYNQADAPFKEDDVDSNYILPATTESHIAIGADYRLSHFWDIGFHASKASDNNLTSTATNAEIGLGITTFGLNLGYRF